MQKHLMENHSNLKKCFVAYDVDDSGYLSYDELKTLLTDMNLHRQFARHYQP